MITLCKEIFGYIYEQFNSIQRHQPHFIDYALYTPPVLTMGIFRFGKFPFFNLFWFYLSSQIINQLFYNPQKQHDAYPLHKQIKTRTEAILPYRPKDQFRKKKIPTTTTDGKDKESKLKQKNQAIAQKMEPVRMSAPLNHFLMTAVQSSSTITQEMAPSKTFAPSNHFLTGNQKPPSSTNSLKYAERECAVEKSYVHRIVDGSVAPSNENLLYC